MPYISVNKQGNFLSEKPKDDTSLAQKPETSRTSVSDGPVSSTYSRRSEPSASEAKC